MRAALLALAVVASSLAIAPMTSSTPRTVPAATCTSTNGPGIPPPASVATGVPGFHAAWFGQSGYQSLCPGQVASAVVAYYNSGSLGWVSGRMGEAAYLGTWDPEPGQDRPSAVGGDGQLGSPATGWPRYNRVAAQPASYVGPGQVAWFQFALRAPMTPGTYRLALRPLIEGATWMEDYGVFWVFTVLPADGSGGGGGGGGGSATPTPTATATATATATSTAAGGSGFVGNNAVEGTLDPSGVGATEATQYTATSSGPVSSISIFIDSSNAATSIALGIYSDASGVPGMLLAQGSRSGVTNGAWNSVSIAALDITAGTPYWIARLAVSGGSVVTRGNNAAGNPDRVDTRSLSALPTTFSPGASYPHRASMYAGTAAGGTPPPTPSPTPLPTATPLPTPTPTPGTGGTCLEVIGFSQTQQWYYGGAGADQFLSQMPSGGTQLRWQGGASIDAWADPSFWPGLANGCSSGSSNPDRVVLNISGGYSSDVNWWHDQIMLAVTNVRNHYPAVRTIYLQPVVGGPNHALCPPVPPGVRASFNEPYIGQAIDRLQSEGFGVWGANPLVRTCADYADYDPGHLTDDAKAYVSTTVGGFYRNR